MRNLLVICRDVHQWLSCLPDGESVRLAKELANATLSVEGKLKQAEAVTAEAISVAVREPESGESEGYLLNFSKRKGVAHIWKRGDTACRMFSTGGIKKRSYRVFKDPMERPICLMCQASVAGVPYPEFFRAQTENKPLGIDRSAMPGGHSNQTDKENRDEYTACVHRHLKRDGETCQGGDWQGPEERFTGLCLPWN